MFKDVAGMYTALQNLSQLNETNRNCLLHDAALYGVNATMTETAFHDTLKSNFLSHPFIVAFLQAVRNSKPDPRTPDRPSMQFGPVRIWFANNTTEAPARPWELTSYVDVLYDWAYIRMREIDPLTRDLEAFTFPMRVARLDDLSPEAVIDLLLPEEKT